jgi:hypothetical protein
VIAAPIVGEDSIGIFDLTLIPGSYENLAVFDGA